MFKIIIIKLISILHKYIILIKMFCIIDLRKENKWFRGY